MGLFPTAEPRWASRQLFFLRFKDAEIEFKNTITGPPTLFLISPLSHDHVGGIWASLAAPVQKGLPRAFLQSGMRRVIPFLSDKSQVPTTAPRCCCSAECSSIQIPTCQAAGSTVAMATQHLQPDDFGSPPTSHSPTSSRAQKKNQRQLWLKLFFSSFFNSLHNNDSFPVVWLKLVGPTSNEAPKSEATSVSLVYL